MSFRFVSAYRCTNTATSSSLGQSLRSKYCNELVWYRITRPLDEFAIVQLFESKVVVSAAGRRFWAQAIARHPKGSKIECALEAAP